MTGTDNINEFPLKIVALDHECLFQLLLITELEIISGDKFWN